MVREDLIPLQYPEAVKLMEDQDLILAGSFFAGCGWLRILNQYGRRSYRYRLDGILTVLTLPQVNTRMPIINVKGGDYLVQRVQGIHHAR